MSAANSQGCREISYSGYTVEPYTVKGYTVQPGTRTVCGDRKSWSESAKDYASARALIRFYYRTNPAKLTGISNAEVSDTGVSALARLKAMKEQGLPAPKFPKRKQLIANPSLWPDGFPAPPQRNVL